jgi:hypothetical protein
MILGSNPASCGQKSLPAALKSICADNLGFRADENRFVRPFSRPCGENSICAGDWLFRAGQLSVRAGKNQSVRPLFDLCAKNHGFYGFLHEGREGGEVCKTILRWTIGGAHASRVRFRASSPKQRGTN